MANKTLKKKWYAVVADDGYFFELHLSIQNAEEVARDYSTPEMRYRVKEVYAVIEWHE